MSFHCNFHPIVGREREQKRGEGAAREAQIDEQRQALRQKGALLRSLQVPCMPGDPHVADWPLYLV